MTPHTRAESAASKTGEPYTFIECIQTIFPIDGRAKPVVSGTVIPIQGAQHLRPPLGEDLGGTPRERHAAAAREGAHFLPLMQPGFDATSKETLPRFNRS